MSIFRKFVLLMICLSVIMSLAACGESDTARTDQDEGKVSSPLITQDETPQTSPDKYFEAGEQVEVDDYVAFEIVNAYRSDRVTPSNPSSYHRLYEAESGYEYIVVRADVSNLQATSVSAESMIVASLSIGGNEYQGAVVPEEKDGSNFTFSIVAVSPLEKVRIYYLFNVPSEIDGEMEFKAQIQDETFLTLLDLEAFKAKKNFISTGKTISDDKKLSLKIEEIYFIDILEPPNPTRSYHYFEPAIGNTFLVVETKVKNLKGNDLRFDDIAGVSCTYKDKYNYSAFVVFEEDGGKDLSSYTNLYSLAPLDSCKVYFVMELPDTAIGGQIEIRMNVVGEDYYINIK